MVSISEKIRYNLEKKLQFKIIGTKIPFGRFPQVKYWKRLGDLRRLGKLFKREATSVNSLTGPALFEE